MKTTQHELLMESTMLASVILQGISRSEVPECLHFAIQQWHENMNRAVQRNQLTELLAQIEARPKPAKATADKEVEADFGDRSRYDEIEQELAACKDRWDSHVCSPGAPVRMEEDPPTPIITIYGHITLDSTPFIGA